MPPKPRQICSGLEHHSIAMTLLARRAWRPLAACVATAWLTACGGAGGTPTVASEAAGPGPAVAADDDGPRVLVLSATVDGRPVESSENIHLVPPLTTLLLGCSSPCGFTALEQDGAAIRDVSTTSTTWTGTLTLSRPTSRLTVHARIGAQAPVSVAFMTPVAVTAR